MSQFSSDGQAVIDRTVENKRELVVTPDGEIADFYSIPKCIDWIKTNSYKRVCLQFPDYLLPDSAKVALALQNALNQTVYILGDTAYESCCIDYVAAAHVEADAIIHFGQTCFSKQTDEIPSLFIYEKSILDWEQFSKALDEHLSKNERAISIVLDAPYLHLDDKFKSICDGKNVSIFSEAADTQNDDVLYVCDSSRKIMNFNFIYKPSTLYFYDNGMISNFETDSRILKRRYFLIEKIKDSNTLGIIIGTLAVKNYLNVIQRIKRLLQLHKKKYYLISIGKPNVAKLANFPEMDVYILISCSMNEIYDSREFFKPIVTTYDVELALNPKAQNMTFTYDFNSYLDSQDCLEQLDLPVGEESSDVSLLSGKIRMAQEEPDIAIDTEKSLLGISNTVSHNHSHGAGFLAQKSWKGLEQNLGQSEVQLAQEGRSGIAQTYTNEIDM